MIVAVLQARASSTRLPGKVLAPVIGRPMLALEVERIARCRTVDELVVATSTDGSDDPIEALCAAEGVACFRGSLDDVLDRFYRAVADRRATHVVRFTGDCPLIDHRVSDAIVRFALDGGYDYASNTLHPTFPDGLDTEAFTFAALETAWREARLPSEREHVTPYIYHHAEEFRLGDFRGEPDLSHLRWTVDRPLDLDVVRAVYERLYPSDPDFGTAEVLELMRTDPRLRELNASYPRNEGWERSLADDAAAGREE